LNEKKKEGTMPIKRAVPETTPQTSHTAAAQELIAAIRATRQKIPNFTIPESARAKQAIAGVASIPPPFIERAAVAVTNSPTLVRGGAMDPQRIRDLMSFGDAYITYADELEAMASFVRHSVAAARNEAARDALTTYALAQRLAKLPATADLAPYVADMRNALARRGRNAKAKPSPAPGAPAPTPVPVAPPSPKP
jgi:hypothetical protein